MKNEQLYHLLFILLRSSLLKEDVDFSTFKEISTSDWRKLYELSQNQGLLAITFDCIQKHQLLQGHDNASVMLLMEWMGYANMAEHQHQIQSDAIEKLTNHWAEHGIKTVALKGPAYSRFYPNPNQRPSTDFDCYLFEYQEKGNQLIEELGIPVDRSYYKNSAFKYEGLAVENHSFTTQIGGMRGSRELERYLIGLLKKEPSEKDADSNLLYPSPLFNAIHMIRHAQCHFLREGFTLKFVCDWLMFEEKNKGKYNRTEFDRICKLYGMDKFVVSLTHLAECIKGTRTLSDLTHADQRLLDYIFHPDTNDVIDTAEQRWNIIRNTLHSGWKYRLFSSHSHLEWLIRSGWEYLFVKNPKI